MHYYFNINHIIYCNDMKIINRTVTFGILKEQIINVVVKIKKQEYPTQTKQKPKQQCALAVELHQKCFQQVEGGDPSPLISPVWALGSTEQAQLRATEMIETLEYLSYEERLFRDYSACIREGSGRIYHCE